MLASAVAAHRAGRLDDAAEFYDRVLSADPDHGWANYFRGVVAQEVGDVVTARTRFMYACSAPDVLPQFHIALGNLELDHEDAEAAACCFRAAIAMRPDFAAAHTGLCLASKHLGQLDAAVTAACHALQFRRGWHGGEPTAGFVDPAEAASMCTVNRVKLRHDIAQLRHLQCLGRTGPEIQAVIAGLETLLGRYAALPNDTAIVKLSQNDLALTCHAYNRAIYIAPALRLAGLAVNPEGFASADAALAGSATSFAVVDSALTPGALESLQRLLTDSTFWFDVKDHGGHLGAYFEEGLACGLTVQIANELRAQLPRALGGRRLAQLWAFKYQQGLGGTELHADIGAVSVNLWVTPDSACLDTESGGLEIVPFALPPEWDFRRMNVERDGLQRVATESGIAPIRIPHRCNRMVVFPARLLHRSAQSRFAEGYLNRRTNVTFLFA